MLGTLHSELRHEGADGRDTDHFPDARSEPIGLIAAAGQRRVVILRSIHA